jgi:hypothetical protein
MGTLWEPMTNLWLIPFWIRECPQILDYITNQNLNQRAVSLLGTKPRSKILTFKGQFTIRLIVMMVQQEICSAKGLVNISAKYNSLEFWQKGQQKLT